MRLSDDAKIMYGKIARLSLLDGYCWSSNSFLDGTKTGRNASRFIAELRNSGYVSIENERSKSRKIRICRVYSRFNLANFGEVINPENANLANFGEVVNPENANLANFGGVVNPENANLANFGGVVNPENANLANFGGVVNPENANLANFGGVVNPENANLANSGGVEEPENANLANSGGVEEPENANLANSGDRTSSSSLNLYNKTTTASCPGKSNDDLPTVEKVVAAACLSPKEIKTALLALDKSLIFDNGFYANAAAFMAKKEIGLKYLSWLYEQCSLKENIRSFKAYYFSVFFLDNVADGYKAAQLPEPPESKPPPQSVVCEACGKTHARSDDKCPFCGLPEYSPPDQISLYRELNKLPPDKREEYLHRQTAVYEECGFNFEKLSSALAALNQEYGLTVCR